MLQKRSIPFILIIAMIVGMSAHASAATFSDLPNKESHWSYWTILWASEQGIVNGYEDGSFRPNQFVSEAEFLSMLLRFYENTSSEMATLEGDWRETTALLAGKYNVKMSATNDLRAQPISRGQVAQMIAGAYGKNVTIPGAIGFLYDQNISQGRGKKTINGFVAADYLTRAEAVTFLYNLSSKGQKQFKVREPLQTYYDYSKYVTDSTEHLVTTNNMGRILINGDTGMELYFFNPTANENYAKAINAINTKLPNDVKVYSMLIPTQIEFTQTDKYDGISFSQKDSIHHVNEHLDDSITTVNVYDILQATSKQYTYFRTDHHWTALGAYYAYTAFMETIGGYPVPLSNYQSRSAYGYQGTIYQATRHAQLRSDTFTVYQPYLQHEFTVYKPHAVSMGNVINTRYLNQTGKYSAFMSGDHPLGKITTNVKNGKKIAIVKDSYANPFIPFLIPHYQEVYIIDPRMYTGNLVHLVNQHQIKEVLFMNYALVNRYDGYSKLFHAISN